MQDVDQKVNICLNNIMFGVIIRAMAGFFRSRGLVGILADIFQQNHSDLTKKEQAEIKNDEQKNVKKISRRVMENLAHYSYIYIVAFAVVIAAEYTAGYFSQNSYIEDLLFVIIFPLTVVLLGIIYTVITTKRAK